ncbi:2-(3-amino-3-carboxypropyl)histidine synthase subunit 2 [Amphibalanus amphitrite]|uniref:2-(3-amino-3-carboxypropyl)histidine synthase subunit 2 n=1 Tax=Amphibalanus amphitrite TaxID=1232801 RepID=A0A6A4VTQ0_AMPAM|nr:2-(3-amino-3-carboxypropyl)histidine synthase subunit 2 [Amphibalanus amphitrite]
MSVAFSGDDSAIINEKLDVGLVESTPEAELEGKYDLQGCSSWLKEHNYRIAALQFPDNLLADATPIALYLQDNTECQIYILADTSYGSCCVDEVAADHVTADCVIHFGHACLSATSRLPVYYVFVDLPLDVSSAADVLCPALPADGTVVVFVDVRYQHALAALCRELSLRLGSPVVAAEPPPSDPASAPDLTGGGEGATETVLLNRRVALSEPALQAATVVYVGGEGRLLTCLAMALGDTPLLVWDPSGGRSPAPPGPEASRAVRRRYYMVERTKDAARVGVLVGTLAVRRYREAIERLKQLLRAAGKRCYTLLCGKLNVAKLANFPELDVLVLVSCPESALLDSKEFLQPVVTPYEAELACNPARQWSGRYVAEFGRLLPGGAAHVPLPEAGDVVTDVSLVTGRLRSCGLEAEGTPQSGADSSLVARDNLSVAVHGGGAGQALSERSWRGLEQRLGDTPVTAAVQGQRGVAAGYDQEGTAVEDSGSKDTAPAESGSTS